MPIASLAALLALAAAPSPAPAASPGPAAGAATTPSMFELYAANRKEGVPSYVTEDFLLLGYAMAVADAVQQVEEAKAYPELKRLVKGLLDSSAAEGKEADPVRAANRDFLAVVWDLLEDDEAARAGHSAAVTEELRRVRAASGLEKSQLVLQTLDYSQFAPRGHYTKTEALQRYFRGVKYASAVLFPVVDSAATGLSAPDADRLSAQALALSAAVARDETLLALHRASEERLAWLFGPPDDLGVAEYAGLPAGTKREDLLKLAREKGLQPTILSGVVQADRLEKGRTTADVLTGWRLLPQRRSADAAAFQQLVFPSVGEYRGKGTPVSLTSVRGRPVKGFPLALELPALLGSPAAGKQLDAKDERNYEGYAAAAERAKKALELPTGLASEQLALLKAWLAGAGSGSEGRRINSVLSLWTWQRATSVLHAKQSYTSTGRSLNLAPPRAAWLEPGPELYRGLAALAAKVSEKAEAPRLAQLGRLLERCAAVSEAELKAPEQPLSEADAAFVNDLDLALKALVGRADEPVVVDVHTDPNSKQVLEEGLGYPALLTRDLPGAKGARGALFTHVEFKQPMDERLTNEAWRARLGQGAAAGK